MGAGKPDHPDSGRGTGGASVPLAIQPVKDILHIGDTGDFSDFISVSSPNSKHNLLLLIDTEACISVVKKSMISGAEIDETDVIKMKGITSEMVQSIGSVKITIIIKHLSIEHKFYVTPDDFPIPSHGILGKDFTKRHNCVIDYGQMTLKVAPKNVPSAVIEIQTEIIRNVVALPPRSETFKLFRIRSNCYPCVAQGQDVGENVFIPTTIIYEPEAWIRVLNLNDKIKYIQTDKLKIDHINEVDIFTITKNNDKNEVKEREKLLEKTLEHRIPAHAKAELLPLCKEFAKIFHLSGDKPTVNNFYRQKLLLRDNEPVYVKNYRLPQSQKTEVREQVKKLLADGLIELSTSNYNSPLIVVPKKSTDGVKKWRLCVDFRLLNKKLIPDKHPLPRIDEILDGLGRARYFSVMDLQSGYHQIPLEKESRPLTAFSTDSGFYQFKVLPFGISTAPAAFTRMMMIAFSGLTPEQAFIYMDDLIVIGFSEKEHLINLRKVFETCEKFNLKLNPEKCNFFRSEVYFLGHKCTSKGILPDPTKLSAVQNYPKPKSPEEAKRFTAFANYYRRFIPNFSAIAKPLNDLSCKRKKFVWTEVHDKSFETLKKSLITAPVLSYPDFTKPFRVTVDASQFACGAVLSQDHDGVDKPIAYISRTFKKGELNKPIIEKELMAIHFAVTVLRPYLYGRPFTVYSDHKPLIYLYKLNNPSSKLTRIRLDIEEYNFDVVHIKGTDNVVADALSRISLDDIKYMYNHEIFVLTRFLKRKMEEENKKNVKSKQTTHEQNDTTIQTRVYEETHNGLIPRVTRAKLTKISTQGSKIKSLTVAVYKNHKLIFNCKISATKNGEIKMTDVLAKLDQMAASYELNKIQWPIYDKMFNIVNIDDFLEACKILKNIEIVVIHRPPRISSAEEKSEILKKFHNDELYGGHCGQKRMYAKLREQFYWPRMSQDIARYVKQCHVCKLTKPGIKTKQELTLTKTPLRPFDIVQIDTIGPMMKSENGFVYAITLVDELSKYLVIIPIRDKSAKTIAREVFRQFILKYGPMKALKSDLGTEYVNSIITELCKMLKIKQSNSTAYHHETVGSVERSHRILNEYLRAYLNGNLTDWDTYADYFAFNYNTTPNQSSDYKYTPFEMVFARKPNINTDLFSDNIRPVYNLDDVVADMRYRLQRSHLETRRVIEKIKLKNKMLYDRNANEINVNIGDMVKIRNEPYEKFKFTYSGPFKVIAIDNANLTIDLNGKRYTVHKNRVLKY